METSFSPLFILLVLIVVVTAILIILTRRRPGALGGHGVCRACGATHPQFARFCRRCGKQL